MLLKKRTIGDKCFLNDSDVMQYTQKVCQKFDLVENT